MMINVDSTIQFSKNKGRNTSFKTKQKNTMYKVPSALMAVSLERR